MYTLATMTEIAPSAYFVYAESVVVLLSQTLNNLQDLGNPIAYYVIQTLQNLIPLVEGNQNVRTK